MNEHELAQIDAAAAERDPRKLVEVAALIRLMVAQQRGELYAFRPGTAPGLYVVSQPYYAPATVYLRAGATGMAELHDVMAQRPQWVALPGSRSAIHKRLAGALAAIEQPTPDLAQRIRDGLRVRAGAAQWVTPWQWPRFHVATT